MFWTLLFLDKLKLLSVSTSPSSLMPFVSGILEMLIFAAIAHVGILTIQAYPISLPRNLSST